MYICEFTNLSLHDASLLSNKAWPYATPIVSFTCVALTMQEVLKTGDRSRTSLRGSETVVRVEGTQTLMHSMYTFNWMANKVWGQVRVCQWKVHACGESVCTSVTLAELPHLY